MSKLDDLRLLYQLIDVDYIIAKMYRCTVSITNSIIFLFF